MLDLKEILFLYRLTVTEFFLSHYVLKNVFLICEYNSEILSWNDGFQLAEH